MAAKSNTPTETHVWGHTVQYRSTENTHAAKLPAKRRNDVNGNGGPDWWPDTVATYGRCLSELPAAAALGLLIVRFIIAITASTTWPNWRACAQQAVGQPLCHVWLCEPLVSQPSSLSGQFLRTKSAQNNQEFLSRFHFSHFKNQYKSSPPKKDQDRHKCLFQQCHFLLIYTALKPPPPQEWQPLLGFRCIKPADLNAKPISQASLTVRAGDDK